MFFIPKFLKPKKNLVNLLRVLAGVNKKPNIQKLIKSVDVYNEPLQKVFLLASVVSKFDKSLLSKQLAGVLSHEKFGNAMNMAAFQKICKLYNNNGIVPLAQKGLVQKLLYPQSTRPMNDADFAVPKNVYRNAINLATTDGFHINHDMLFSADLQLRDQGCVDVHYALFKGANPRMDDEIFNRASHLSTMGCDVLIPSPEDIIVIIMCEFYGNFLFEAGSADTDTNKIFDSHPQWVLDTYKIIHDYPELNWGKIMKTAKMSGYDYQIRILTKLLNKIIPNIIPRHAQKVMEYMCPDRVVKHYLKRDKKLVYMHQQSYKYYQMENL